MKPFLRNVFNSDREEVPRQYGMNIPCEDSDCTHRDQSAQLAASGPLLPTASAPLKTLMNLTTSVDTLAFSPDTQVRSPLP